MPRSALAGFQRMLMAAHEGQVGLILPLGGCGLGQIIDMERQRPALAWTQDEPLCEAVQQECKRVSCALLRQKDHDAY